MLIIENINVYKTNIEKIKTTILFIFFFINIRIIEKIDKLKITISVNLILKLNIFICMGITIIKVKINNNILYIIFEILFF